MSAEGGWSTLLPRATEKYSANHKTETICSSTVEEALSSPELESVVISLCYRVICG